MLTHRRIIHSAVCFSVFWLIHGNPFETVLGGLMSALIGAIIIVASYHLFVKRKQRQPLF